MIRIMRAGVVEQLIGHSADVSYIFLSRSAAGQYQQTFTERSVFRCRLIEENVRLVTVIS